ncbi:MAG: DNA gyrase subunit A [Spiroplasma poulsonii]|uniref:DNA gyrase subunit A n=1 Tax=Spiroplasma poulsonii TaxID=2138 RepID=A0A2P6F9X5_9MOLU|nr:DNA gyrase subunit A [Spiroplasma poulsonii]MBW1242138.1 DNA gyrase subunit A [Spiroplasma poulsonii]PQM30249.1 DNA gyrase subunit A [Spiroplasma poulsonii]PWF95210.1 DNA gyrase subunit A [Spiroplasma poulsonii]PWF98001.1 DNA gyrase subunit A [Spiroplasma poulsonii]
MNLDNDTYDYDGKIRDIDIADEMKNGFLDYAMSVIVSRAIPDVRDGLKPVHRRIIYAMWDLNMTYDKQHKKSARIVGEVIGKYHPHGDTAVYEAMVRMAQDFSYRYPLIDGHGNFGSMDGDAPAAMRYTEARMSKIAGELIKDIEKETTIFIDNYDGSEQEPTFLPGYFPNLLVNGASGIAVGMATNIPPHNLNEVIDGVIALTKNGDITTVELMKIIKGPDFPTGALITAGNSLIKAYETGNGTITIRSKIDIEENNNKRRIIVSEIPYQVNKAKLLERIAELVRDKIINGISDLRDESNMEGVRVVLELKRDAQENVILNKLYKLTPLQTNFSLNILALYKNQPKVMGLKQILKYFVEHQIDIIVKRSQFELHKNQNRLIILEGLKIALDHIDEVITIIKKSQTTQIALEALIDKFKLVTEQARAILEMRLQRLTGLEIEKINNEISEIKLAIIALEEIINNSEKQIEIMINELVEIKKKYGDERRSQIIKEELTEIDPEELIRREDILIMLTQDGYVKRVADDTFKLQNRGGKGITGLANMEDSLKKIVGANSIDSLLIFSNFGKVYKLRAYQIETYSRHARGLPIINLIAIDKTENIQTILALDEKIIEQDNLFFVTKKGLIKKTKLSEFNQIRQTGKVAIELKEKDELVSVIITKGTDDVIIGNNIGKVIRFNEKEIRAMSRQSVGVKGISNDETGVTIGVSSGRSAKYVLSVTENGYAKKTPIEDYRLTGRNTKGVKSINLTEKTGYLKFAQTVVGDEDLLVGTKNGNVIRVSLEQVPLFGRTTSGVKIIRLDQDDKLEVIEILKKKDNSE